MSPEEQFIRICRTGKVEGALELIDSGVNINYRYYNTYTGFEIVCDKGHIELARVLLQKDIIKTAINDNSNHYVPLQYAIVNDRTDICDLLIEHGADINICSLSTRTPLMVACNMNNIAMVQKLLSLGVNVNYRNNNGTALLLCKSVDAFRLLYVYGADINVTDDIGDGFLHALIYMISYYKDNCVLELLRELLNYGADVNLRNNKGKHTDNVCHTKT